MMAREPNHFRSRPSRKGVRNRPVVLPAAPYVCPIPVSPHVPKPYRNGAMWYTWPGLGTELEFQGRLTPCGYRSQTEAAHLVHLVVTHHIELDQAKAMAQRHAGGRS